MTEISQNPYEAPAVMEHGLTLAADTEFLFNDQLVAGVGDVGLPRICVLTGSRENLLEKRSTFHMCPLMILILRRISVAICVPVVAVMLLDVLIIRQRIVSLQELLVVSIFAAIAMVFWGLGHWMRQTLHLRWFISDRLWLKKQKRIRTQKAVLIGIIGLAAVFWMLRMGALMIFFGFTACVYYFSFVQRSHVLVARGRYRDLVLVEGFKRPFVRELREIVQRQDRADEPLTDTISGEIGKA